MDSCLLRCETPNRVYLDTSESFPKRAECKITRRMKQHGDRYRTVVVSPSTNAGNVYITYRTVSQFKTSGFQNYQRMAKQHGEIASERSVPFREATQTLHYLSRMVSRTVLVQNLGRAPPKVQYHITTTTTAKKKAS
jgi:hypothetical protein